MDVAVIHDVMNKTQAGEMVFPQVVGALSEVGVESYFCDLVAGRETFYGADGAAYTVPMSLPVAPVAEDFSGEGIVAAIRGAQADTIRYPEFVRQSRLAGVAAYWAFLTGRQVTYFGRKGESHTERFPSI
jgi:uncharacterized protein YbcV (DUF1398 family)